MYKLKFTLKQHTPIIHFQHKHDGATLRASEVKPMLDRYIISNEGGFKHIFLKHSDWFIGQGEFPSLNYKLKINQITVPGEVKTNPNYFGNPRNLDPLKQNILGEQDLKCSIIFFEEGLKHALSKIVLMEFFLMNNFGCRKSKGSGSYTLSSIQLDDEEPICVGEEENITFFKTTLFNRNKTRIHSNYLSFTSDKIDKNKAEVFGVINYYWKKLRSGINYTYDVFDKCKGENIIQGEYQNSFLLTYLKGYTWEKRWLKEKFMNLKPVIAEPEPKFARAILGLSDKYTFLDNTKLKKTKLDNKTKIALNFNFDVQISSKEIQRIPSPITFKPIILDNQVYIFILIDEGYANWDIISKKFDFIMKTQSNIQYLNPGTQYLFTPNERIDLSDLLSKYNKSLANPFIALALKRDSNAIIATVHIKSI